MSSIDRVEHGHDVRGRDVGEDVVDLLEDETAARPENLDLLLDVLGHLLRRGVD